MATDAAYVNVDWERLKFEAAAAAAKLAFDYYSTDKEFGLAGGKLDLERDRLAFDKARDAADRAMKAMELISSLRGPRNAFKQQEVMNGLNAMGLSRSIDAIKGLYDLPSFQGAQANPEAATLANQVADLTGAKGTSTTGATADSGFVFDANDYERLNEGWKRKDDTRSGRQALIGDARWARMQAAGRGDNPWTKNHNDGRYFRIGPKGGYQWITAEQYKAGAYPGGPNDPAAKAAAASTAVPVQAYLDAAPALNKIVGRNFLKEGEDTQQFQVGLYEQKGHSANDMLDTIKAGMPKFRAPSLVGQVK